ncbi:MAG TPA: ABC transporter ATP-binding protein, partial [Chryseosolibacter sp.]|nr:ABC transporter ATP-binding protein [Chryseosolibacter sp.]
SDFTNHVLLPLLALVTDTIVTICVVAFLFWYDYKVVFALAVVLFPILLTYYLFKTKIVSRIKRNFQEEIPKSNIIISQGIDAFAEAKIYRKEDFFMKRFSDINSQTSRHLADLRTAAFIPQRILEIVAVFSLGLIFTLSHFTGNQSGIVLTGIVLLAFYKLGPALNRILINATEVAAFAYTIDLIKRPFGKGQEKHTHPTSEFKFSETICADKISFNYKDTDTMILNQFSFIINKGDFVIVEGPSGAGKSTLLNILSGLLTIRSGKIQIDGVLLSAENIQQWQSKIAFVPQSGVVIDDTILANVAFGEDPDKIDVARVNEVVGLVGLLDFVGQLSGTIHHQIGENGLTISGGQRQRLLLARALYRNPQVLIVDEVTNQLDYDNKIKLLEAIRSLTLRGLTVIFATHDTLVKTFADKTISVGSANKEFPEKDILMASIDHNDVSVR